MTSITDRLKASQVARALKPSDISLRGTGIHKRELERASNAYERETAKTLERGGDIAQKEAEEKFQHSVSDVADALIAEAKAKNIDLDPSQLKALRGMLLNQVCCLIGAAGTGKTTITRMFIRKLVEQLQEIVEPVEPTGNEDDDDETDEKKPKKSSAIACAAYTGRASQQMRKAIGSDFHSIPISTIHSLLGYAPTLEEIDAFDPITRTYYKKERRVFRPTFGLGLKLPYKIIILDEASMIPIPLFNELIDALMPDARIILIGDIHQLPPVYGKSVLGYALRKWPTFELDKIHRQAEGNPIIANAHNILHNKPLKPAKNVVLMKTKAGGASEFSVYIRNVIKILHEQKRFDPYRDVIIVANSNPEIITSAPALNEFFVTFFNAEKKVNGVIVNKRFRIHTGTQEVHFAVGDKIMINQNINNIVPPITNGMMGIVDTLNANGKYDQKRGDVMYQAQDDDEEPDIIDEKDMITLDGIQELDFSDLGSTKKDEKDDETMDQRQSSHVMTIKFDTGQTMTCSTAGDYRKISFGYAITCHKSQGGEYPNVVIAIHSANGQLLTQEWLYTAFTRARDNVYLLHNERGLGRALSVQKIKGKSLKEKIENYVIETHSDDMEVEASPWSVDRAKFPILFNPKQVEH